MKKENWINETARVSFTPVRSGDGYSFGGATIVAIGPFALELGEHPQALHLGKEIADRWNRGADAATARDLLSRMYGFAVRYGSPSGIDAAEGLLFAVRSFLEKMGDFS